MGQSPSVILLMRKESPTYFSIERLFDNLLPALSDRFDVRVVNVPHQSRGVVRCFRNLLFTASLRANVIHVTGDIHYCALAVPRQSCVLTVHDLVSLNRLRGIRRRIFSMLWYSLPLRWASRVTAISEATRRQLEQEFPAAVGRIEVIPNCVGEEFRGNNDLMRMNSDKPKVLQVGTGANKNLDRVAAAASGLPLHLRIIGPLSSSQRDLLCGLDLSWSSTERLSSDELIAEYRGSDALVFASTYEGFGLPIVEAQAIGLPVITSNLAPMTEVAGDGALFADPYDEGQIRSALERLLSSPALCRQLSDRGQQNAERFTVVAVADQYASIYERMFFDSHHHIL